MAVQYDWKYENSINTTKEKIDVEQDYDKFRTNRTLCNFVDTILYSNDMNINSHIDNQLHYDYLFYSVKKGKRFFKKGAKQKDNEDFKAVKEYYKYNDERVNEVLNILSAEDIDAIKLKLIKD